MKKSLVVVAVALALGACSSSNAAQSISSSSAAASVGTATSAPVSTSDPAQTLSATPSASSSTPSPTTSGAFDKLPAGYSYAYLYKLTKISGRWSVVLDPVTMCMYPSTDPNCKDLTEPPPNDYELRNLSTKTYTVPLVTGTVLTVVGPSGQPTDYVTVPMAEKTWPTSSSGAQVVVTYSTNAAGEVSAIREWWHP